MDETEAKGFLARHFRNFDELMVHLAADLKQAHGEELRKGLELWVKMFEIRKA